MVLALLVILLTPAIVLGMQGQTIPPGKLKLTPGSISRTGDRTDRTTPNTVP